MNKASPAYLVFKSFLSASPIGRRITKRLEAQFESIELINENPLSTLSFYNPDRNVWGVIEELNDSSTFKLKIYDHLGQLGFKVFNLEYKLDIIKEEGFIARLNLVA